jgi:hypothetical protein
MLGSKRGRGSRGQNLHIAMVADGLEVLRRSEAGFRQLKLAAQADGVANVIRTIEAGEEST